MGRFETSGLSLTVNAEEPYVPGALLEGLVHLQLPKLFSDGVEEVTIQLSGSIHTRLTRETVQSTNVSSQEVELVRQTTVLWKKGNTCPASDSPVQELPFSFNLPAQLPPSYSCEGSGYSARVDYALHVRGERHGLLRPDRTIHMPLLVFPAHEEGAGLHSILTELGWHGGWKKLEKSREIRKYPWGPYSDIHATLSMPDFAVFPTHTCIPFELNIVTHTKSAKRDDTERLRDNEPLFPTPPSNPRKLDFWLTPQVWVCARGSQLITDMIRSKIRLGGFGNRSEPGHNVEVQQVEMAWVPPQDLHDEEMGLGQWKQEVTFKSTFTVREPPTFTTQTLTLLYYATLKIPFPGIGNDLTIEFPIKLVSHLPPPARDIHLKC